MNMQGGSMMMQGPGAGGGAQGSGGSMQMNKQ